jgi:hypothetical protein
MDPLAGIRLKNNPQHDKKYEISYFSSIAMH